MSILHSGSRTSPTVVDMGLPKDASPPAPSSSLTTLGTLTWRWMAKQVLRCLPHAARQHKGRGWKHKEERLVLRSPHLWFERGEWGSALPSIFSLLLLLLLLSSFWNKTITFQVRTWYFRVDGLFFSIHLSKTNLADLGGQPTPRRSWMDKACLTLGIEGA